MTDRFNNLTIGTKVKHKLHTNIKGKIANFEYKDGYYALIEAYPAARIYHSFDVFDLEPFEEQASLVDRFFAIVNEETKPRSTRQQKLTSVPITKMGTR